MERCSWSTSNQQMIEYHDTEWGRPLFSDKKLFEALVLDCFQPGLIWATILAKRENFRKAFDGFLTQKIARYGSKRVRILLRDPSIIRNRLKIEATIENARAFLKTKEEHKTFAKYLWNFVDGKPIQNIWRRAEDIPAKTDLSEKISKNMKKKGFRFVGPTTIYAYMQGVGMVNDHVITCFRNIIKQ